MTEEPLLRIGEAAELAGVSARTLRYYEELGLLTPTGKTEGGARRYAPADVSRVARIRHLRDLVGLDLNEVGRVLVAEDRLAGIREQWFEDQTPSHQLELLQEAVAINNEVQEIIRAKMRGMRDFLAGLEEKARSYSRKREELTRAAARARRTLTPS
jgi:DNA-binding transcriptional MerR regulator